MDFLPGFKSFLSSIGGFGMINSLCQLILKHTCPGVPDTYQGCELWDFSMVDPDNRRPVDYEKRDRWLSEIQESTASRAGLFAELWNDWTTGKIKLAVTAWLLEERKSYPLIFRDAAYLPLQVTGTYREHILAFLRQHEQGSYLIALPLHLASIVEDFQSLSSFDWKDTAIELPSGHMWKWEHLFTGEKTGSVSQILISSVCNKMPFAVLKRKNQ